jgi:hypothetical protein
VTKPWDHYVPVRSAPPRARAAGIIPPFAPGMGPDRRMFPPPPRALPRGSIDFQPPWRLGAGPPISRIPDVPPLLRARPQPIRATRSDGPVRAPCAPHPIWDGLGKIHGSFNTSLGLAAAGVSYLAGKALGTKPSFRMGDDAIQLTNSPLNIGNRAYTLGNVQVYGLGKYAGPDWTGPSYTGAWVRTGNHEAGHSRQSQRLGMFYLPAEAIGSLFGDRNPLEVGADKFALGQSCSGF